MRNKIARVNLIHKLQIQIQISEDHSIHNYHNIYFPINRVVYYQQNSAHHNNNKQQKLL